MLLRAPIAVLAVASVALQRPLPCQSLTGRWRAQFWLDSIGFKWLQPPTRYVQGTIGFDTAFLTSDTNMAGLVLHRRCYNGHADLPIDSIFVASPVRQSRARTQVAVPRLFSFDIGGCFEPGGVAELGSIPLVASGKLYHDTLRGRWEPGDETGARGHFRMVRESHDAVAVALPPPSPPGKPDPILAPSLRTEVRVRVRNTRTGQFMAVRHGMDIRGRSYDLGNHTTGTEPDGWGRMFWLRPDTYSVVLYHFQCDSLFVALKHPIRQSFVGLPGDTVSITLDLDVDSVPLGTSYDNRQARRCVDLRGGGPRRAPN